MPTSLSTAAAAKLLIPLITAIHIPTVSNIAALLDQPIQPTQKTTSLSPVMQVSHAPTMATPLKYEDAASRQTTFQEQLIGEIREWNLLDSNWDGEGACAPDAQSIKEVVAFIRLLTNDNPLPEPMLLASGHAALYWHENDLYADIDFLGDGRIAYFIKRNDDKHKGVFSFNTQEMPTVFQALLGIQKAS
jgi:hypothetical protein